MAFDDLSKFLQAASDAGELERIALAISPDQELAALTHQICCEFRGAGPVILFEEPRGHSIPVIVNLLGNRSRFLQALGAESLSHVVDRIRSILTPFPSSSERRFGFPAPGQTDRARYSPRIVRRGICQQIVKLGQEIDLRQFPALRSWSSESGPFFTAAQVITESSTGKVGLERMPLQVLDSQMLQLHWNPQGTTCRNWREQQAAGRPLGVAISLGGDPLLSYVASLPLPDWLDPWFFAGLLRNECVNLIRGRSVELNVPAEAEIVLEGYLEPDPAMGNGTAASPAGILETRNDLPHLQITSITHRANPLCPAQIHSRDGSEEVVCSQLTEQLLLAILQLQHPTALDLHLPRCGAHRDAVYVSTSADTSQQVRQLLHGVQGLPLLAQTGLVIAVGPQVNLRDDHAVWNEVCLSRQRLNNAARNFEETLLSSGGPLVLDATTTSHPSSGVTCCRPEPEILAALAKRFGNSSCDEQAATV